MAAMQSHANGLVQHKTHPLTLVTGHFSLVQHLSLVHGTVDWQQQPRAPITSGFLATKGSEHGALYRNVLNMDLHVLRDLTAVLVTEGECTEPFRSTQNSVHTYVLLFSLRPTHSNQFEL